MRFLVAIILVVTSSIVMAANEASVRISEDSLSLVLDSQASASSSMQLSYVHNDDNDSDLLSAGLFVNGSRQGFDGRLGGKAYYVDLSRDSGYGMALGGEISVPISQELKVNAGIYYGPSSLSFSDVDGYQEWFVRLNYRLFENARLGIGVISLEIDPERGQKVEVDDGLFIEMNLSF